MLIAWGFFFSKHLFLKRRKLLLNPQTDFFLCWESYSPGGFMEQHFTPLTVQPQPPVRPLQQASPAPQTKQNSFDFFSWSLITTEIIFEKTFYTDWGATVSESFPHYIGIVAQRKFPAFGKTLCFVFQGENPGCLNLVRIQGVHLAAFLPDRAKHMELILASAVGLEPGSLVWAVPTVQSMPSAWAPSPLCCGVSGPVPSRALPGFPLLGWTTTLSCCARLGCPAPSLVLIYCCREPTPLVEPPQNILGFGVCGFVLYCFQLRSVFYRLSSLNQIPAKGRTCSCSARAEAHWARGWGDKSSSDRDPFCQDWVGLGEAHFSCAPTLFLI